MPPATRAELDVQIDAEAQEIVALLAPVIDKLKAAQSPPAPELDFSAEIAKLKLVEAAVLAGVNAEVTPPVPAPSPPVTTTGTASATGP